MVKNYLLILAISILIPFKMSADWISLNKNRTSNTPPKVTVLSDDNNSTVIKIDISGFNLTEFSTEGRTYQSVDLMTDILSAEVGYPELSYITQVLAIPDQSGISLEILETGEVQTFKNIYLKPARSSWIEGEPESLYEENQEVYNSSDIYPKEYAKLDPPSVFRDFRLTRLSLFPLRYLAAKKELQAVTSITIRINYGRGEVINPKTASNKAIAPSFGKLYRSFISNYQTVLNSRYNGEEAGRDVMLCIIPDQFVDSFEPYADWKRASGTDIVITKFSDIGANASNATIIKDHITDAYYNWEYPPTYVLLVGDDGIFPEKIVNYDYSFANEDYFVEIDGDDFFPEMMVGRITNQNDYQLQVMVNKFMKYEKEPYTANTEWFKKGICCSNNDYASQVYTKRFTANVMITDGGFTSVDTLMSDGTWGSGCSMNVNDIKSALNEGRSFLNYRGEGWDDGWHANCYEFLTSHVSSLNNGEKLTFVTSIGCGVAMFDTQWGNCFGEEWLQLGTIDAPRGAIAFVGPTSNTHSTYNNRIDKGIYVGMFQEGMDTPGQALLRGKLYVYNVFGDDPMVEYHYRVFCLLGDPSVHIWKDVPLEVNVSYPTYIPVGYSQPEFIITYASNGQPVSNAQVCLTGDDVFTTAFTDSTGIVLIDVTPETPGTLSVIVRGGTVIPYEGTLTVNQTAEQVAPYEYPEIVDIDGNTDGLINPNENCNITFTLKNWGTQTSNNVEATLSVVETEYAEVITTNAVSFGNLASGATFTGESFQFYVKPECPLNQNITLKLHVTSSTSSWEYTYYENIVGCDIQYLSNIVNDEGSLVVNFRMDPGETVKLFLNVNNIGEDLANDVTGVLRTNDPYITILDTTASFGTIGVGSIVMNSESPFIVDVDINCPIEYMVDYTLKLNTQNGNYPYETVLDLSIPVATPTTTDFTGPDAYGYYAFSDIDTIYEQAPTFDWFEITFIGISNHLYPGNDGDYTETVDLPFSFKYYGLDYSQLRISTDGWIAFGSGTQTAPNNAPLPNNDNVNSMVAPFWDDLYDTWGWEEGVISYYNDIVDHRFIIEWYSIGHAEYSWPPKQETFQIILLDPDYYPTNTGDGEIIFQYNVIQNQHSNTVGIENHTQDIGLQYVFNDDRDPTAARISNGVAIKFTTEFPKVIVSVDENQDGNQFSDDNGLYQNYPNPFKLQTRISYTVDESNYIALKVYNINGELVRTLQNGRQMAGKYSVEWDGANDSGQRMSSGIYFYQLQTGNTVVSKKMFMYK